MYGKYTLFTIHQFLQFIPPFAVILELKYSTKSKEANNEYFNSPFNVYGGGGDENLKCLIETQRILFLKLEQTASIIVQLYILQLLYILHFTRRMKRRQYFYVHLLK